MATARARLTIDTGKLNRLLRDRNGNVGRVMAGFAGLATVNSKQVARERTTPRTRRHIESIKSTTVGSPQGLKVVTSSITYHGAPEKATRPHIIRPVRAKVLRFPVAGGRIVYAREVHHPGTQARNILRDGVRRAGHQLDRITR